MPTPKAQELGLPARLPTPSAHVLASSADVLEALACVLEVQADGREDQNRPRNRQNQLDDDLDGPEQQAVDQSVKNPAEQAKKETSAIRADEAPELAQKVGHNVLIYAGTMTAGENFLSGVATHFWLRA